MSDTHKIFNLSKRNGKDDKAAKVALELERKLDLKDVEIVVGPRQMTSSLKDPIRFCLGFTNVYKPGFIGSLLKPYTVYLYMPLMNYQLQTLSYAGKHKTSTIPPEELQINEVTLSPYSFQWIVPVENHLLESTDYSLLEHWKDRVKHLEFKNHPLDW